MLPHAQTFINETKDQLKTKLWEMVSLSFERGKGSVNFGTAIIEKFSWFEIVWMLEHQNMSKFTKFSFNTDSVGYSTFSRGQGADGW